MDFKKARFNMVEQQIRPWNVLNLELLDLLNHIPREIFVEEQFKELAYADTNLPLANNHVMLEPKIVARLIQELNLNKSKNVLEIATGSGYATSILAGLAQTVDTYDLDENQLKKAQANLNQLALNNINYFNQDGLLLDNKDLLGFYDAIYIGGALHKIPENLKEFLANNGKMVAILGYEPIMHATVITKKDDSYIEDKNIFETCIPYLIEKNYNKSDDFIF